MVEIICCVMLHRGERARRCHVHMHCTPSSGNAQRGGMVTLRLHLYLNNKPDLTLVKLNYFK